MLDPKTGASSAAAGAAVPRELLGSINRRELDKLEREHVSFRSLLDLLEAQLELFHCAEQPDYELVRDIFHYLTRYPDRFHHPKEDLALRLLAEREPAAQMNVRVLADQHRVIAHSGARFLEKLEAALVDAILPRAAVEGPAQEYIAFYRAHMKLEEEELFPLARALLRDEDWQQIDAAIAAVEDPLFGRSVEARYRELQRRIVAAAGCGCATS